MINYLQCGTLFPGTMYYTNCSWQYIHPTSKIPLQKLHIIPFYHQSFRFKFCQETILFKCHNPHDTMLSGTCSVISRLHLLLSFQVDNPFLTYDNLIGQSHHVPLINLSPSYLQSLCLKSSVVSQEICQIYQLFYINLLM